MAINTYGTLKTAVATWLNRADLTSYIPDLIALAEQRINYGSDGQYISQPLRVPAMQARATGTITSGAISYPTRFLEPIRIVATSGTTSWPLDYVAPPAFTTASNSSGTPSVYTLLNNEIQTAGTGSYAYTLDYYQAFAALSSDSDTNWLLTNAPGIYLYATLIEAAPFLGDSQTMQTWLTMLNSSIAAVNRSTKYQGGGSLVTRVVR
jgi:hypothetical protein